jgi:hypothetical protein
MELVRLLSLSKTSVLAWLWALPPIWLVEELATPVWTSTLNEGFELELKLVGEVEPELPELDEGPAGGS